MAKATTPLLPSDRTRLRRKKERGSHDRALIDAILDEGLICHVGFPDGAATCVLPSAYARIDDHLYLHGAVGNHMLRVLASGAPVCVAVTLLDGLVFARSAFHHSMNFRSVVLFGEAREIVDPDDKRRAVLAIVDHMAPGRSRDARPPTDSELQSTRVVALPIAEGSAKVRTGGPVDEPEDLALAVWGGELPFEVVARTPVPDDGSEAVPTPGYVADFWEHRRTVVPDGGAAGPR